MASREDGLGTQVRARKLDWELASSLPDTKHELERWEAEAFDGARAQIILGADIVRLSLLGPCRYFLTFLHT